jgi:hypothetical protein
MAVLKVETDIITNIAWSPKGKACDIRNYVYQEFQNWCHYVFYVTPTDNYKSLSQYVDTDNVSEIKANMSNHW